MAGYDDRDGFIWMDGKSVEWRSANVHILTHALHYASAVFEGERCYNGKIFKSTEHSERLRMSGELLDMQLPYADGCDLLQRMRAHAALAGVPAVVVSAAARNDDLARARSAGFIGYWTKPLVVDDVLAGLDQLLAPPAQSPR